MHKGQVTIIYATNNSYAPYMAISIYSLIKNTSDDIFYKIYILYEVLAEHYKKRIGRMSKGNVEIEFLNVSENMKNKGIITTGHLSKEATHRLLVDIIWEL